MRKILSGIMVASAALLISLTGCNKTGPAGANGKDGANGTNGADAIATCKECHNPNVVDKVVSEFSLSKHSYGTANTSEAGNTTCGVCHESEGFKYVCLNNVSTVWTKDAGTGLWTNPYATVASSAFGPLTCNTCHSSLHTTYGYSDLSPLTTTAAVPMTMWAGSKTINCTQQGGIANLCIKCHQPRPMQCNVNPSTGGRLLNYDSLANYPNEVYFDSASPTTCKYVKPSYRMHVHYGAVGAIFAGVGAIEVPGGTPYTSSPHATVATCQNCHMAAINGASGGHSFKVIGNFNGCNVSGCHAATPISATATKWTGTRADTKDLLDQLATKINACGGGHDILHVETDPTLNLWAGISTGNYDGYLDIYSSSTNPNGYWRDPWGSGTTNNAKPKFPSLKFGQVAAIINFQMCLREYSLGIHNTQYTQALLYNTLDMMSTLGF